MLNEFIPTLESLEAQSAAAIQFLKDQKIADKKKLAPYLENAAKASNVKWLAVRLRLNHLISTAMKASERAEQDTKKEEEARQQGKETKEMAAPDKQETDSEKRNAANEEGPSTEQKTSPNTDNTSRQLKEEPKTEAA